MPKKTLQELYIEALKKRGETEVDRTHKRIKFTRTVEGAKHGFFYIGKNGSLRAGYTSAGSTPVSKNFKEALLLSVMEV